jgi:hypothetical protein
MFKGIDLEKIKNTFQNKKDRQMKLPRHLGVTEASSSHG